MSLPGNEAQLYQIISIIKAIDIIVIIIILLIAFPIVVRLTRRSIPVQFERLSTPSRLGNFSDTGVMREVCATEITASLRNKKKH